MSRILTLNPSLVSTVAVRESFSFLNLRGGLPSPTPSPDTTLSKMNTVSERKGKKGLQYDDDDQSIESPLLPQFLLVIDNLSPYILNGSMKMKERKENKPFSDI